MFGTKLADINGLNTALISAVFVAFEIMIKQE
jgi:hypothetical protein